MTEPRTSRRVARVVLLLLMLGVVAVAVPIVPAVWEWAAYGEWKPIWKCRLCHADPRMGMRGHYITPFPRYVLSLRPRPRVLRDAQPRGSDRYSYFKVKQKRLHWGPGKDLLIRQIGKKEFQWYVSRRANLNARRLVGT